MALFVWICYVIERLSVFIWVARPLPEEEDIQLDGELFTGSSGDGPPGKLQCTVNETKPLKSIKIIFIFNQILNQVLFI